MFWLDIEVLVEGTIYWSLYHNKCDQMTMWGVVTFMDWHCIYYDGTQKTSVFVWNLTVLKWKCQEKLKLNYEIFNGKCKNFFVVKIIRFLKWVIFYILEHSAFIGNLWLWQCSFHLLANDLETVCSKLKFWNCVKLSEKNKSNLH
jgi:hypothetical protein